MLKSIQQRDLDKNRWVKITMSVILLVICVAMVITLIPGLTGSAMTTDPDTVATVGDAAISAGDVQRELDAQSRGQAIPDVLRGIYTKQVLDNLIFQQSLELEAQRLGMRVTPDEETERIKQILPTVFNGDTWLKDRYASEVQRLTGMTVPDFESKLRDLMLQERFHSLVTDGITVTPAEVEAEFRRRNEKVQIQYAVIKPADLASTIHPSDAELAAYFSKNSARYQIPERRSAHYALLDLNALKQSTQIPEKDVQAYYNEHITDYKVENRVHAEHILFKTVGQTDAEVAETQKKAEDVLKQAKHGANFEDLAKKYSEDDATKPKGGDLGWIVEGQTVPEFQQAAFSLPKGSISDLVKTQYGFHIIKVLDHEQAHTRPLDEVRSQILPALLDAKVDQEAASISDQMATAIRQSNRQSLDDLAKKFNLQTGDTPLVSVTEPVGVLGNSPDVHQWLFQLRTGELSRPIQITQGFVILTPKDTVPAHAGTLAEVHDKVLADYQQEKSLELAQQKAAALSKEAQSGEAFDKAAKALGLDAKTSDPLARDGNLPDVGVGSSKALASAFNMPIGGVSAPIAASGNWIVYRVQAHDMPNPDDLAKQSADIQQQLLQTKQQNAYSAFHDALQDRLRKEGKIHVNDDVLKRLTKTS
ncbi:MAG: peptidylprolyl isomerase [Candidatus Acidiferrales bacterium]